MKAISKISALGKSISEIHKKNISLIFRVLKNQGYQIFLVGGCVRDLLLGKTPPDFDFATDARPEVIVKLFTRVIPTGMQHGTVSVLLKKELYEITTFRSDGTYKDGRRPESIIYEKHLDKDVLRRDFTINGLAYDYAEELLYDYVDGRIDLEKGIIRAIGNPLDRFSEDGLRCVRALRFQSVLGFAIEEETFTAIEKSIEVCKKIAIERFFDEFYKAFKKASIEQFVKALQHTGLWDIFIPDNLLEEIRKSFRNENILVSSKNSFNELLKVKIFSSLRDDYFPENHLNENENINHYIEAILFFSYHFYPSIFDLNSSIFDKEKSNLNFRKSSSAYFQKLKRPISVHKVYYSFYLIVFHYTNIKLVSTAFENGNVVNEHQEANIFANTTFNNFTAEEKQNYKARLFLAKLLKDSYLQNALIYFKDFLEKVISLEIEKEKKSALSNKEFIQNLNDFHSFIVHALDVKKTKAFLQIKDLAINGKDLSTTFSIKGKVIGSLLEKALQNVLLQPKNNSREVLLSYLSESIK